MYIYISFQDSYMYIYHFRIHIYISCYVDCDAYMYHVVLIDAQMYQDVNFNWLINVLCCIGCFRYVSCYVDRCIYVL